ncbi:conserved hypothetical protein [Latilactobacillus fuchuensis]|jgi:hypothetical protein|uniref:Transmembrane protein n=3 Tax=Latilactobacillus fuchuensis TaxID=164393 RepID=A0A2N9DTA4_9LACO|nr:hypothetical protein [Latilactobacillus fuchuensis]KRL60825.1 hypothetical protein FC69_GL001261 [Latilactobacillus fuchuensis DSM 14340 = JCM 11249]MCP8857324.1 hypothetical protein [Latilactobacillus fuchuensis]SPC36802.1 conserved hypothetical protein [Latilactobacillus fuchuensis]
MMTKDQTLMVLNVLKKKLQSLRLLRIVEELFSLYVIIEVFTASNQIILFGISFSEKNAVMLMLYLLIIDFCINRIRVNYKKTGQQLIQTLKNLTEQEQLFVKRFERF